MNNIPRWIGPALVGTGIGGLTGMAAEHLVAIGAGVTAGFTILAVEAFVDLVRVGRDIRNGITRDNRPGIRGDSDADLSLPETPTRARRLSPARASRTTGWGASFRGFEQRAKAREMVNVKFIPREVERPVAKSVRKMPVYWSDFSR